MCSEGVVRVLRVYSEGAVKVMGVQIGCSEGIASV